MKSSQLTAALLALLVIAILPSGSLAQATHSAAPGASALREAP